MEEDDGDGRYLADRRGQIGRKLRDISAILPLLGLILLATPIVTVVAGGADGALIYVFAVWGLLILGAWLLSGRLRDEEPRE
jgi:hypothetical protein